MGSICCCALLQWSNHRGVPRQCWIQRGLGLNQKINGASSARGANLGSGLWFWWPYPNSGAFFCMPIYVIFFARFLQFGYFLLAATVQFINLTRHFPNLHCWRRFVSIRKLTLIPNLVHLKLWLCVILSFGTISPQALIVHCGWTFNGAMHMPGRHVILPRGRGTA